MSQNVLISIGLFIICFGILAGSIRTLTRNNTLGSDFYIFYLAGNYLVNDHTTPYSEELAVKAQHAIYKRDAAPGEDQLGFAYPPYSLLPVLPLLLTSFEWAQAIWMSLSIMALITAIFYSSRRGNIWLLLSVIFLYPVTFGIILGNFAILITAILIILYTSITQEKPAGSVFQIISGVLMAWITCKPQFTWLFILFLIGLGVRKRNYIFLASFLISFLIMLGVSFWLLPTWPAEWTKSLNSYAQYNQTRLMINFFMMQILPAPASTIFTIIFSIAILIFSSWLAYHWWQGKTIHLVFFAWCALLVFLFHPRGKSYEQVTYLLPMVLWLCQQKRLRNWPVLVFWFGNFAFFWITFYLSLQPVKPLSVIEWPFAGFLIWLIWFYLISQRSKNNFQSVASS